MRMWIIGLLLQAACGQTTPGTMDVQDGGGDTSRDVELDAPRDTGRDGEVGGSRVFCSSTEGPVDSGASVDGDFVVECMPGEVCGNNGGIAGCICCVLGPLCSPGGC